MEFQAGVWDPTLWLSPLLHPEASRCLQECLQAHRKADVAPVSMSALHAQRDPGVVLGARAGAGTRCDRVPGPCDPQGPSGRTEPGPPAGARPDWRPRPASRRLTCHSQPIGATRIGAVAGGRGRCCRPEAERPSPPSSCPALCNPEPQPPAARPAPPSRGVQCPARFDAAAPGRGRSASLLAGTPPDGSVLAPRPSSRFPADPGRWGPGRAQPC